MHFEILVEDQSGKRMLELLLPKLISAGHTTRIHPYKGVGRLPKGLRPGSDADKRILLDQLPKILQGLGKTFAGYGPNFAACVVVVIDIDSHPLKAFTNELQAVVQNCRPAPITKFCVAVEEGEAWLLGDQHAIITAYPRAKVAVLKTYRQDSICGTWEVLADAVHPGGASALKAQGWQAAGAAKSDWAKAITPHLEVVGNKSPSFQHFCTTVRTLATTNET